MKATVEIPDELYRQVKAKSALEGRAVRDVTVELYESYVGRKTAAASPSGPRRGAGLLADGKPAPPWFALARAHVRRGRGAAQAAVRKSIARGWAQEVAESEAALPRKKRR